jgi:hypothetical protein
MPQAQRTQRTLLAEGFKSYPEALAALREFRRMIVQTVHSVVDEELGQLSRAMNAKLPSPIPRRRPDRLENDKVGEVKLGVAMRGTEWRQYHHISWHKDQVTASCSIVASDPRRAELVYNALQRCRPVRPYRIGLEDDEVYLERSLTARDMDRLEDVLRALLREWTRLWGEAGGLQHFRARAARA